MAINLFLWFLCGQIIATSHDLTPKCGWGREIPVFQVSLGWWIIVVWPVVVDIHRKPCFMRATSVQLAPLYVAIQILAYVSPNKNRPQTLDTPKFNIALEKWHLEDYFPYGFRLIFRGELTKFVEVWTLWFFFLAEKRHPKALTCFFRKRFISWWNSRDTP